jgi:hypothetical protein
LRNLIEESFHAHHQIGWSAVGGEDYGIDLRMYGPDFCAFFLLIGLMGSTIGKQNTPLAGIFGVAFAIFMPLLYGAMGFVTGVIGALLYNLFARWVGGFELEMELCPQTLTAPYSLITPASPPSNS